MYNHHCHCNLILQPPLALTIYNRVPTELYIRIAALQRLTSAQSIFIQSLALYKQYFSRQCL